MTEQSDQPGSSDAAADRAAPAAREAQAAQPTPAPRRAVPTRKLLAGVLGVVVLAVLLVFGVPWIEQMLNTVSTDDAYVNGACDVRGTPRGRADRPRSGR